MVGWPQFRFTFGFGKAHGVGDEEIFPKFSPLEIAEKFKSKLTPVSSRSGLNSGNKEAEQNALLVV